jgi:hypothetical protein
MTIRARRPDPAQCVQWQMLPMMLANAAQNGTAYVDEDEAKRIMDLLRELLVWCCLEPRVSTEPKDESEIHPREIADKDLWFIVGWALRLREVEAFRPFRRERAADGSAANSEAVLLQTFEPAGNRGPVGGAGVRPGGGETGDGNDGGSGKR